MTLAPHMAVMGLPVIEEDNQMLTMLRAHVYDSDSLSAYPNCTSILNVSKTTTKREIVDVKGVPENVFRLQNINLSSGEVNALEYGNTMFGLPSLFEIESLI